MAHMSWWDAALLFVAGIGGGLVRQHRRSGVADHLSRAAADRAAARDGERDQHRRPGVQRRRVGVGVAARTARPARRADAFGPVGGASVAPRARRCCCRSPPRASRTSCRSCWRRRPCAIALPQRDRVEPIPRHRPGPCSRALRSSRSACTAGSSAPRRACCMLALFLRTGSDSLAHANATKNVVLGVGQRRRGADLRRVRTDHWLAVVPLGASDACSARASGR